MHSLLLCLVGFALGCHAFLIGGPSLTQGGQRTRWLTGGSTGTLNPSASQLNAAVAGADETNPFGSKLMADVSEDELEELFKEFNITNFSVEKDKELNKWAPSKEFFEKYAFQNMTEKYKRKVMDVKIDFYASYNKPILPQYKTFIADVMAMTYTQTVDARYKYDALHAFGICTQYYTIMKGYALSEEVRRRPAFSHHPHLLFRSFFFTYPRYRYRLIQSLTR